MTDTYAQLAALVAIGAVALLAVLSALANTVAESDWWVIARGITRGRYERLRRNLRGVRRG